MPLQPHQSLSPWPGPAGRWWGKASCPAASQWCPCHLVDPAWCPPEWWVCWGNGVSPQGTTRAHRHPHTDTHRCVHMDIQKTKSVREEKEKSQLAAVEEHHDPFHSDIQQTELWLQKTLLLSSNESIAAWTQDILRQRNLQSRHTMGQSRRKHRDSTEGPQTSWKVWFHTRASHDAQQIKPQPAVTLPLQSVCTRSGLSLQCVCLRSTSCWSNIKSRPF